VHGHDREEAGPAPAPDEHLLVVELLEIPLDRLPATQWPLPEDPSAPGLPEDPESEGGVGVVEVPAAGSEGVAPALGCVELSVVFIWVLLVP
jgi:hypothetical protein